MSWYCKINDRETGPMEERTVINRLIDGEINSRTMLKDRFENDYRMLLETDFNAVLGHLTARWRYNIGALTLSLVGGQALPGQWNTHVLIPFSTNTFHIGSAAQPRESKFGIVLSSSLP